MSYSENRCVEQFIFRKRICDVDVIFFFNQINVSPRIVNRDVIRKLI